MNETRRTQTHTTGRPTVGQILKQAAHAVGCILAGVVLAAAVSSCTETAIDCTAPGVVCDF